jgi:hypothetical protein
MAYEAENQAENLPEKTIDYNDALAQIQSEIKISRDFVKSKRLSFRSRLKLYNNQRKQTDKIGDTSIFNVMTTMLAVYYSDEMQVSFQGREVGDTTAASNIENTAKFDHDEMGMDIINYLTQWDRLFFGVGIRQCSEWDIKSKTPIAKSLSALSWLPDPRGGMDINHFRFVGFEVEYTRDEMKEEAGFFNLEYLPKNKSQRSSESDQSREALRLAQGLDNVEYQKLLNKDSDAFDMVDIFTTLTRTDGTRAKYLVTVDDEVKNIFRCEEIEPVTKKEKENPELVSFPITLNYYMPQREDPFGVSIPDLIEDKQRAKSIFKNLRIAAAKANLYPMYLYNRDKILNRRDLDFAFNKFIAVRGDVNEGVVQPLNKNNLNLADSLNTEQGLDADIEVASGSSRNAQGVLSEQQRTLGEVESVQANANLRYLLGSKINAWGEKRFWRLWYRLYQQNLLSAETKVIRIQSAIGSQFSTITRKAFITKQDPDIYIGSKLEVEQKRNMDRIAFAAIAPLLMQDPSLPASSRNFTKRHLLKLHGIASEQISIMVPDTIDEMKAKMENELLSRNNNEPEIDIKEDHLSHIVIHSQAEKTDASMAHIQAHKVAYFESGMYEMDKQIQNQALMSGGQAGNMAANQNANLNANINNSKKQPIGVSPMAQS